MTRIINAIDAQTAQRIRDAIAGKPQLREAKPKKAEPVKCYVSQFHKYDPAKDTITLQLPIAFRTAEYNADHTAFYLKAKWAKEKRELVWSACAMHLHNFDRERLAHIEFVRLALGKLDDDNLVAAFKAIRDALCSHIVWGSEAPAHLKSIGKADDYLAREDGVTWSYRQQKCESNPRLYGVRLILHLKPRTEK